MNDRRRFAEFGSGSAHCCFGHDLKSLHILTSLMAFLVIYIRDISKSKQSGTDNCSDFDHGLAGNELLSLGIYRVGTDTYQIRSGELADIPDPRRKARLPDCEEDKVPRIGWTGWMEIDDLARVVPRLHRAAADVNGLCPLDPFQLGGARTSPRGIASIRIRSSSPGAGDPTTGKRGRRSNALRVNTRSSSVAAGGLIPSSFWRREDIAGAGKLRPDSHWATALWLISRLFATSTCVRLFCSRALRRRMPKELDTADLNRRVSYIYLSLGGPLLPVSQAG